MSINNLNTYLNVRDAHLRVVSGNVYAQAMNIGGINVETAHGLQSVSNTGNATSLTLEFANVTTGFVTTANVQIGRDLVVTGNATVSTDLTVSANATVTDTLTITEHLIASKEATVTGNLHVTTIRSDSNVVAEYTGPHDRPLRKYPEVALTSASDSGYVTSSSTTVGTYYTWKAFDNNLADDSSVWTTVDNIYDSNDNYAYNSDKSLGGVDGEWLKIELPNKIKPSYVRIYPRTYVPPIGNNQSPEDFKILASNDDTNWVELVSVVGWVTNATWGKWDISSNTPYKYFAIVCTRTIGAATFGLAELEYYGYEEGSGSLDTTLKSVYNVPATTGTQLEVYYDGQDYSDVPSSVTDKSGNGNHASTVGTGVGFDSTYKAFTFDGSATGVISNELPSTVTGAYVHSMSLWFKHSGTGNTLYTLVHIGDANNSQSVMSDLLVYDTGKLRFGFYDNDSDTPDGIITLNQWYHVVATYSGGTGNAHSRKIYVNGKEITLTLSGAYNGNSLSLPSDPVLYLGSQQGSIRLTGSIANFRLYSKALNADQVKELYDYQKDYFLGSKSQLTLYKGHLGVGVTEPSGQLELAGDERIQEYPPGILSDYETYVPGHGVFCIKHSGHHVSGPILNAFNKKAPVGDFWYSDVNTYGGTNNLYTGTDVAPNGVSGEWMYMTLPYHVDMKSLQITARNGEVNSAPKSGIIFGSADGGNTWDQVGSWSDKTSANHWLDGGVASPAFTISSTKLLNVIGFVVTHGQGSYAFTLGEIRFFGIPRSTILDKGSLTLGRSLDVPRVSRYDVDTETPRPEKLVVDFDTTVNSSPTDISGKGNHGAFYNGAEYSASDKAFKFVGVDNNNQAANSSDTVRGTHGLSGTRPVHSHSVWFKQTTDANDYTWVCAAGTATGQQQSGILLSGSSSYPNRITFDCYNGWVTSTVTAELNRWYHVVATFNGGTTFNTTNCRIYVDGVDCTGPSSEVYNEQTFNLQGAILALGSTHNGTRGLTGLVSNYKLYDVVLEPSEVRKLYRLGRTGRSMVISDTAVGIGKVPEAQLDVRGNLNVDGVITNQQRPAFYVWRDGTGLNVEAIGHGGQNRLAVTGVITNWDSKRIDTAGTFDLSNGRYYIPVSGLYNFVGAGLYRYQSGSGILEASFYVNGSNVNVRGISYNRGNTTSEHHTVTITFMRFMNAGDYVQMGVPVCQSACDFYYGDNLGYFSGYLLG